MFKNNSLPKLSDEELLLLFKESGEKRYFAELFKRYLSLIYGVCLKYLKDASLAEDAVFQLFENLHDKIDSYEIDVFRPWIYRITKNHCLQLLQKDKPFNAEDVDVSASAFENEKETSQNELEDSFSQDAKEGYDEVSGTAYHVKNIKKEITKQTGKKSHRLQFWIAAASLLLIICLSFFFFWNNRTLASIEAIYHGNHTDSFFISKYTKDSLLAKAANIVAPSNIINVNTKSNEPNKPVDLPVKNESTFQQKERKSGTKGDIYSDHSAEDYNSNPTLSANEITALLSGYDKKNSAKEADTNNLDQKERPTPVNNLDQISKPAIGVKAYSDYIEKSRRPVTDTNNNYQRGKVILMFKVNKQGRPVDIAILRSLNQSADKEAIRLLQSGPNWTVSDNLVRTEIVF